MNKFKISHLKAMKKADLYSLCLTEFGNDTATIYQHYSKAEMIDDLMTVATPDEVAAEPDEVAAEPEPTTHILEIPFTGFYESYHANKPSEIILQDIANAGENGITLTDEDTDRIWYSFDDGFKWREYFELVADSYAHFVLCTVIEGTYQDLAPILQRVEIDSPSEYNFMTDKIYAVMTQRPQNLTLEYFKVNDLIEPLLWFIEERYSSRSGYISFVNTRPKLDEMFAISDDNPYIDCAMYVLTCHAFGLDPYDGYTVNAHRIDRQFIDFMYEHGYYDDFVYANTPAICLALLHGKQI